MLVSKSFVLLNHNQVIQSIKRLIDQFICRNEEIDDDDDINRNLGEIDSQICEITNWSEWSECSVTCGIGFRMKSRRFIHKMGRKKCSHIGLIEKEKCMNPPCASGTDEVVDPSCKVTEWSDWSPCSASCGQGVKFRTRLLMVDPSRQEECSMRVELLQQRTCLVQANCNFDMATAKIVCMEEADVGPCRGYFQRWAFDAKRLTCVSFGYSGCRGNRNNFLTNEECNTTCGIVKAALTGKQPSEELQFRPAILPPIDCMVSEWSPWSPCSVTCGTGRVTSNRIIKVNCFVFYNLF